LDEPLANLDLRRETELVGLISELVKRKKITALLIAHDINPLIPFVNKIIYIANGRVDNGHPETVITSNNLSRLYESNIEVIKSKNGRIVVIGVDETSHHE
jgi:zinc/manganese transport system ATP-binding protein